LPSPQLAVSLHQPQPLRDAQSSHEKVVQFEVLGALGGLGLLHALAEYAHALHAP